jgi:hypothetical protein
MSDHYIIETKDGFDMDANYAYLDQRLTYADAREFARAYLAELNDLQPDAGGQGWGGIQDLVYVVHPDGRRERIFQ